MNTCYTPELQDIIFFSNMFRKFLKVDYTLGQKIVLVKDRFLISMKLGNKKIIRKKNAYIENIRIMFLNSMWFQVA